MPEAGLRLHGKDMFDLTQGLAIPQSLALPVVGGGHEQIVRYAKASVLELSNWRVRFARPAGPLCCILSLAFDPCETLPESGLG